MEKHDPIIADHAGSAPGEVQRDIAASADLPEPNTPIIQRDTCREMTDLDQPDPLREEPWPRRPRLLYLEDSGRAQAGRYTFDLHPDLGVMIDNVGPPEDE